jgi:5-carboxymethyl-2-hydroxymuconic-semialdehyde dehydrogenase
MTMEERRVPVVEIGGVPVHTSHWIGGRWVDGGRPLTVHSPIDGSTLGAIAGGGPIEVDAAVAAASAAFPAWAGLPSADRTERLLRLADVIEARAEELAVVECHDTGLPLQMLRRYVPTRIRDHIAFYARLAADMREEVYLTAESRNVVRHEPAGVAAVISTWNGPLSVATSKLGPALAAGDTVVVKPPEWAPFSCALFAALTEEAGLPPGVVNVVQGLGSIAGRVLAAHRGIARLSFTGSPATARHIGAETAANIVPVCFELGGKSPLLVFAGADLEAAAEAIAEQYFHAGQICAAGTRVLVEAAVVDELLALVRARVEALVVGDPRETATEVGPLITEEHRRRVSARVARAVEQGAVAIWGGAPVEGDGYYFQPTLLTAVEPSMEIWQEEVFGPVLLWDTFVDEAEAVAKANSTAYGLAAHVWTADDAQADRLAGRLTAGTVWLNCSNLMLSLEAPFGGVGISGIGREGGRWSLEFFCEVKNVSRPVAGGTSYLLAKAEVD